MDGLRDGGTDGRKTDGRTDGRTVRQTGGQRKSDRSVVHNRREYTGGALLKREAER